MNLQYETINFEVVDNIAIKLTDTPQNGINNDIVQRVADFVGELASAIRK